MEPEGLLVFEPSQEEPVLSLKTPLTKNFAVTPDFRRAATADHDPETQGETAQIWDLQEGKLLVMLEGDTRPVAGASNLAAKRSVSGVALSPDGRLCALSGSTVIRVWDVETQQVRHTIDTAAEPHWSVAFSPDGRLLATAGGNADDLVKLYDMADGRLVRELRGHEQHLSGLAFSPDGLRLATSDSAGEIRLWNLEATDGLTITFPPGDPIATSTHHELAFGPDGRWLAVSGRAVVVRDASQGGVLATLPDATGPIALANASPTLLTADPRDPATWKIWDLSRPKAPTATSHQDRQPYVTDPAISADLVGGLPAIASLDITKDGRRVALGRRTGAMMGPHGMVFSKGLGGGPVRLLERESDGVVWTAFPQADDASEVALSPDGRMVASGSINEGSVTLLDATNGRELARLEKAHDGLCAVRFSPDGRWLATSGFNDKLARIWDVSTRREVHALRRHTGPVLALAFTPDSQRLATAGSDGKIAIWDVITGQNLLTLEAHRGWVDALAFSRDGQRLASFGRNDHSIKIWDGRPLENEPPTTVPERPLRPATRQ